MPKRIKKKEEPLSPVRRLAVALGHPLRLRILSALVAGEGSATTLSRQFGDVSVGDVSYHLGVLADDCELIELVRAQQVRGAQESFYRLKPGAKLGQINVPPALVPGLRAELFRSFVDATVAALEAGSLDAREDTIFAAKPVTVDQRGMAEINTAMREALQRVKRAEADSRRRLKRVKDSTRALNAVVGAAAFEAVTPLKSERRRD
jgi:DNA-binding transcriptional ArsR family regulator